MPLSLEQRLGCHKLLTDELHAYLGRRLAHARLPGEFELRKRTKGLQSARDKMVRKGYESIEDLTDLTGVRIIVSFETDVSSYTTAVMEIMGGDIHVARWPARDTHSFWYESTHLEGTMSDELALRLGNPDFARLPFEIQVRSIFQHAWADAEHGLGYKGSTTLPWHIQRIFAQLAALTEVSDQLLNEIRHSAEEFRRDIEDNPHIRKSLGVDVETLAWYVQNEPLIEELDRQVAGVRGIRLSPFDKGYMNKLVNVTTFSGFKILLSLDGDIRSDLGHFERFIHAYNSRERVRRRPVLPGYSVELYAEYRALRPPPGDVESLVSYFGDAHGWPHDKARATAVRLLDELGEPWHA